MGGIFQGITKYYACIMSVYDQLRPEYGPIRFRVKDTEGAVGLLAPRYSLILIALAGKITRLIFLAGDLYAPTVSRW